MSDASPAPPEQAGAAARFLVVNDMPMLVLGMGDTDGDRELWRRLGVAGLTGIPGFYGFNFPRGAQVGFTLTFEHMRLEDDQAKGLLQIPRSSVDADWLLTAKRMKGTMLAVGLDLDLDPDSSDKEVCDLLDARAKEATASNVYDHDIRAAIVGVAEPREGLPLFF